MRQRSESVVLQFEQEIRVIERSSHEAQLRGVEAGWAHDGWMRRPLGGDERNKSEGLRRINLELQTIIRVSLTDERG